MKKTFYIILFLFLPLFCFCDLSPVINRCPEAVITPYDPAKEHSPQTKKIVLAGGCFDVLHIGHIEFLKAARSYGEYLIVALEPDEKIRKYKKREPIHNQQQRAEVLASLRFVDEVLLLPSLESFDDYQNVVIYLKPAIIATTTGDPQLNNKIIQATAVGAQVVIVNDLMPGFSSTSIIQRDPNLDSDKKNPFVY